MILTRRTKVGMIQQNYNVIGKVDAGVEENRFKLKTMQKITLCTFRI